MWRRHTQGPVSCRGDTPFRAEWEPSPVVSVEGGGETSGLCLEQALKGLCSVPRKEGRSARCVCLSTHFLNADLVRVCPRKEDIRSPEEGGSSFLTSLLISLPLFKLRLPAHSRRTRPCQGGFICMDSFGSNPIPNLPKPPPSSLLSAVTSIGRQSCIYSFTHSLHSPKTPTVCQELSQVLATAWTRSLL